MFARETPCRERQPCSAPNPPDPAYLGASALGVTPAHPSPGRVGRQPARLPFGGAREGVGQRRRRQSFLSVGVELAARLVSQNAQQRVWESRVLADHQARAPGPGLSRCWRGEEVAVTPGRFPKGER